ncbi:hypothetical protein TNCV_4823271 [Trichonephila clavipes]|nr:hypothetical protein TNCV_4823271 [Trichonephila clavipes]
MAASHITLLQQKLEPLLALVRKRIDCLSDSSEPDALEQCTLSPWNVARSVSTISLPISIDLYITKSLNPGKKFVI